MPKLTSELKTALLNELCYGKRYGTENCQRFFSYLESIINRDKTLLIGDYILSGEQLDDLYEIVSSMYSTGIKRHSNYSCAITVLAIVNICRDFDLQSDENRVYEFIQKKLFGNSPYAAAWLSHLEIYNVMKLCFDHITKHILFGSDSRKSYRSTILCQALAPKSSFFALLDALWFIHNERVDDTYFEEDYSDIADAFHAFFSLSQDENEGISVGSQSYAIRSGIRNCAIQDRELFIGILKRAFGLLSLYYDNGGEDNENRNRSYFVQLFEEWYQLKQATIATNKRGPQIKREPTVRDYRTAKIKYVYDSYKQSPYLVFPQRRLTGYSEDRPVLTVRCGDEVVETRNLELGGSEFMRVIRPFSIELTKYALNNLEISVSVTRGKEVLYESGSEFKRNILIFSGSKEITGQHIEKGYYTTYFLGDGDDVFCNCRELCENIYSVQFEVGDDFDVYGVKYHIVDRKATEERTDRVTVIGRKEKGVSFALTDDELPVYSHIEEINFTQNELRGNFRIELNGKNYAPDHISTSEFSEEENCFIRIWDTSNYETAFKCLLINGFRFSFDQKYYYDKFNRAQLIFSNSDGGKEVTFHFPDESVRIPYLDGALEFIVPAISWTISGADGHQRFSPAVKPVWYAEIKQNAILRINAPSNVTVEVYNMERAILHGDEPNTFMLGQSIFGNENKQTTSIDEIYARLNGNPYSLCRVAYYPQINQKPQIKYDAKRGIVDIDYSSGYVGPSDAIFAFELDNGNCIAFESFECPATYHTHLNKDTYAFRMYWLKSNTSYGFGGLPKKVMVYESEFSNGTPEETKFARKTLRISEYVDFDNLSHKLGTEYYATNIQYFRREDGFDQYACDIFRDTWKGRVPLYKGYIEIIKNKECLLYFFDKEYETLNEFIFKKDNGFIFKEQKNIPTSEFISCNYLKYEEND